MSTSVCQGMQSQFDPWLVEPRIIGFKLSKPTPKFSLSSVCFPRSDNSHTQKQTTRKSDICSEMINQKKSRNGDLGWSFLEALTKPTGFSEILKNEDNEKAKEKEYVHPLVKKSASMLSEKSLEMCTESLGSETGSTISDTEDELISSSFVSDHEKSPKMQPCFTMIKERSTSMSMSMSMSNSFPPPITTLRSASSGGVHVESQREDGRLVIKAVSVGTNQSCFMAERTNGRLTLRFLDNSPCEVNRELVHGDEFYDGHDNNEGDLHEDEYIVNEMEGNIVTRNRCNDELAAGRCKGLQNWEPYWVASS